MIDEQELLKKISNTYDLDYGEVLINPKEFYDMIEETPKYNTWIFTNKNLPSKSGSYLTYYKDGFGNEGQQVFYWDNNRKGFYPKWEGNPSRHEYAWMPLPETYKKGINT